MTAMDLINRELAKAKTHASVIAYSDGSTKRLEHNNAVSAENHLRSYRQIIGKHAFISRKTGEKISVVSCAVEAI